MRWLLATALVGLTASTAAATTMRMASAAELGADADVVVVASVESSRAEWVGTRIYTRHRVKVSEVWKGKTNRTIDVLTLGGVVGELGQSVPGAAKLPAGKQLLLYLARGAHGYHPVGLWQGVFVLTDGKATRPNGSARTDMTSDPDELRRSLP